MPGAPRRPTAREPCRLPAVILGPASAAASPGGRCCTDRTPGEWATTRCPGDRRGSRARLLCGQRGCIDAAQRPGPARDHGGAGTGRGCGRGGGRCAARANLERYESRLARAFAALINLLTRTRSSRRRLAHRAPVRERAGALGVPRLCAGRTRCTPGSEPARRLGRAGPPLARHPRQDHDCQPAPQRVAEGGGGPGRARRRFSSRTRAPARTSERDLAPREDLE